MDKIRYVEYDNELCQVRGELVDELERDVLVLSLRKPSEIGGHPGRTTSIVGIGKDLCTPVTVCSKCGHVNKN